MKNIHVIPKEKFTKGFINRINKEFGKENNFFLVIDNTGNKEPIIAENVKIIEMSRRTVLKNFKTVLGYKKLFFHNISYINPLLMLLLSLVPKKKKKQYWVMWGMDLYCHQEKKEGLKETLAELIRTLFIRNIYGIIFWVKGDYELACKWYKTKAKYFVGGYSGNDRDFIKKVIDSTHEKKDEYIRIQVGNSGAVRNNHIEALRKIKQFDLPNMLVYAPLSYAGTKDYIEEVVREGKALYGDRFIPIMDMMPKEKYIEYLNGIDIGVFNTDRQMGLGNISLLAALGKKVFINDYTTSWEYYANRKVVLFPFNKLDFNDENCKKEFFTPLCESQQKSNFANIIIVQERFNEYWETIFES